MSAHSERAAAAAGDQSIKEMLAHFGTAEDGTRTVTSVKDLDASSFAEAVDAMDCVNRALNRAEVDLMRSAYTSMTETLSYHGHLVSTGYRGVNSLVYQNSTSISAQIFGWLSSARLFLDHSAKQLSDIFGKDSDEFSRYKRATNWAYDNSIGYRFCDALRNAFQHAGVPPITMTGQLDADDRPALRITAKREALLSYASWKPRVRGDIEAMSQEVDIQNLFGAAEVQYEFVAGQVRDAFRTAALPAADHIDALSENLNAPAAETYLVRMSRPSSEQIIFTTHGLPLSATSTVRDQASFPPVPTDSLRCAGSPDPMAAACHAAASALIISPHATGVVGVVCCDVHQRYSGRRLAKRLGATNVLHIALLDYMRTGVFTHTGDQLTLLPWSSIEGLQQTSDPLPDLTQGLTEHGWRVPRDPELLWRSRLAVHVLDSWRRNGGGAPGFFDDVNAVLAEHRSIEPLLTGLVNISTVMLSAVSSMQGSSPEVVLGILIEDMEIR